MAIKEFDVFVIGTGNSGKTIAFDCAAAGMKVAIADNREYGGTCANRGCDPKKVIAGVTDVYQSAKNLEGKGLTGIPKIDWENLQEYKQTFTSAVPAVNEKRLKKAGISLYHQSPKFLDENTLSVEGKTVKTKKVVIASGMVSMELKIPGREYLKLSDDFLALETLPKDITFIGGGYIGIELAHIAARCGAKVTVIEFGDTILDGFDKDLTEELTEISRDLGITILLEAKANKIEKLQKNYRVYYETEGEIQSIKTELVFNTAGRIPSIADLDLTKGNVEFEKRGITVNEFLQSTSNPNVYACGDVAATPQPPLTPTANLQAVVLSANIRKGNTEKLQKIVVPSVVHCVPQLAMVGMSESEIEDSKDKYQVNHKRVPHWFSAKHLNESNYTYKVIIDKKQQTILGAHILASNAGELINLFTLAINQKMKVSEIKALAFTYPTWGSDIKAML
ncbi:dihydrolipoyl dehydrogenase family protein [Brumimicrobium oceani]|uniref:NAD(P)/FAD-dependent oxidoreductase n=1 Tax=Brumimicrobium oceani TaxID=2100725 RepID=A0A2U2XA62_9FLAO|nr:NAD(P)/FAD-dependent oxidoreductase [Brumimicrobium oceani]PWH84678.1 NAD(P)/FAD-dependent oxidoreductase [Brumimicrobium oceani]